MVNAIRPLAVCLGAALSLAACGGGSSGSSIPSGTNATMSVALVDAPFRVGNAVVSAVNVSIAKVEAMGNGNGGTTIATFSPSLNVNLLSYQTSPLQLGSGQLSPGHYQQIRLILDTSSPNNNNVVVNGTTYPLTIPSATGPSGFGGNTSVDSGEGIGTSGIKVNVGLNAQSGQAYGYLIDFNAAESIVLTGSGTYMMKPVLVATAQALAGSVSGTVKNNAGAGVANAEVLAQQNGQTVNSGVTDASGNFQINALPAGTYTLVVMNSWTNQAGQAQTATGADGSPPPASVTDPTAVTVTGGQTTTGISITD